MNALRNNSVSLEKLQKLYRSNQRFHVIFDHLATRQRNWSSTGVDRLFAVLVRDGKDIARSDIIEFFRELEQIGCGKFVVGRWGHPSRFQWDVQLVGVGQAAAGEAESVESIADATDPESASEDVLVHLFKLRPDFDVSLELPSDLSLSEAARLADFVKTLPFERQPT